MLKSYLSNFCLKTRALSSFRSLKALGSLLLLLFVGTEAQGILLVSNFGQPTKTDSNGNAEYHSYTESKFLVLGFFTPDTLLHTLTAIKIIIAADGKAPRTIELLKTRKDPPLTTFSLQGTYNGSGTNTYIPNKETVLKKDTLYFFVLGHSKGGWGHVVQTSSNDEDAASQQGWNIGDNLYSERLNEYVRPASKIEVHGNYYFAPVSTLAAGGALISNIDGGRHSGVNSGRQEFTTGSWPNGYKIRSIEVRGQESGTLTSQGLYQGDTKVADFTATGTPITVFTPTKSLTLAPKTTYSFRASNSYWLTSGSISAHTGWSLGAHSPAVSNNKMMMRIRADEVIAPAVIATPKTLVSNIKQGGRGTIHSSSTSYAQAFRTGINPHGYALRGVGVYFGVTTAPPRATIHENSPTGKKVATFEPPHSGSSLYGLPDYVVLKKATTYYVVFSGGDARIRTTPSNHVDDDSLAAYKGWNIAHILKYESGGTYLAASSNEAIRLRIAGEPLASPPSQPTNVRRTAGNGRVTLTWGPPLVSNYAPLLNYRINYKKTKDPNYSSWKDYPANARRAVIASLTNGEQYDFQIRARSSEGQGPIFKTTATPNVVPSAPRSFKARGAPNNEAHLSWDAPTTGIVDYYQYRYYKPNENGTWTRVPGGASARSMTIGGLIGGNTVRYNFYIRAVNSAGLGASASVLNRFLLQIGSPANLRVESSTLIQATLSWAPPAGQVGASSYQYRYKTGTGDYPLVWTDVDSGREQTITGLTAASTYTFQVRLEFFAFFSAPATVTFALVLNPPQNLVATAGHAQATLAWEAPTGATPTGYQYRYKVSTDSSYDDWTDVDSGREQTITDLTPGTAYSFEVRSTSTGVSSSPTLASTATPLTPPSAFQEFYAFSNDQSISLNWSSYTGHESSEYRYKATSNSTYSEWADTEPDTDEHTITSLTNNVAYTIELRSKHSLGPSATATATATPNSFNLANAPSNLAATLDNGAVVLTWDAPTGGFPTNYQIRYKASESAYTPWVSPHIAQDWNGTSFGRLIIGLTNGTTYTFQLRGAQLITLDPLDLRHSSIATITATPSATAIPTAPEDLIATPASTQVTLAWYPPARGATPTGYQYRQKTSDGSYLDNWADTSGGILTLNQTITSLTNNTTYNFQVRAKSDSGPSTEATVNSTPNSPPTFSSSATASVNEGTISVATLTATDTDTDDNTFTYSISSIFGGADSAKFSLSAAALSFKTAPDFENPTDTTTNNEYIITLRVTSGSNLREITTEQTLTVTVADTDEAPNAPNAPTVTDLASTTLTLNWTAPTNTGPPITDYDYRYRAGNAGAWTTIANTPIGTTSTPITTLAANTSYQVGIRATNDEGDSDWSTSTSFTTPAAPPTAPQNLTATPASAQVTLAWTAPASGTPTGYQYRHRTGSPGAWISWTDVTSGLNQTITSLTNNTTYNFQVRAKSDLGPGTEATVNSTPNSPPTFSSSATASVNEGTISVATLAATDTDTDDNTFTYSIIGGADSAKFSLSAAALSFKTAPDFENPTDVASTTPQSDAENNVYIVTLSTTSGSGDREISTSQTLTVTVADTDEAPEAPAVPTLASRTPTTLTLNWTAPTNAGPPITDYDYRYRAGNAGAWNIIANISIDTISTPFTTLTASTSYQVGIRATNAEGTGDWSTSTSFTTLAAPPSAPQNLTAQAGNNQATLAWTAPASGTPTGYQYRHRTGSPGAWISWTDVTSGLSETITSLINNTTYNFQVRAKSDSGPSTEATVNSTPNSPPTFSSSATASVNEGTTAVTTLTATDTDTDDNTFTYSIIGGADSDQFSLSAAALSFKTAPDFENPTDATTNNEYIVTLSTTSGSGDREISTDQTLTITVADTDEAPEAPAVPTLDSRTPTTLTLNWIAPTNAGPPITDYDYRYRAGNAGAWNIIANDINDALTFTFTTLAASTSYQVGIRATNAEGTGDWSTSTSFTTLPPPNPPQNLTATAGHAQTTLAWTAPASGTTPTGYQYRFKVSTDSSYGEWTDVTSGREQTITDLTPGTAYTFEVRATNTGVGSSPITTTATPLTPPSAPSNLYAIPNDRFILLAWDTTHTSFEYRYKTSGGSYNLWANTRHSRRNIIISLTNNTAYTIELRGKYPLGPGATATATATPNPVDRNTAPYNFVATSSSGAVTLTWDAPTGGFPDYEIRYKSGGAYNLWANSGATLDWNGTNFSRTISSLTDSTAYTFEIRGKQDTNYTPTSTATATTPASTAPQNLTATPASNQVTLAWEAPASVTTTGYEYRHRTGSPGAWISWTDVTSGLNQTITSLTNNTTYNFQVRAKSDSGPSTEATVNSTPNTPPAFSSSATASVNEGTISVATLTATDTDTDDNTFTYSIVAGADSDQFSLSAAALSFKTAPDFENPTDATTNNEYIVTLSTTSGSGDREISTSQTLTITVADTDEAPEAPAVPTLASRTSTTLTLNWTAPTNAGPPITDYDYRYRAGNAGAWNIIANDINDALTFTFTTLTASTSYQVGIRATNAEGTGSWSTSTSFTTLPPPNPPQNLVATAGYAQTTLAWDAPNTGTTPTGYQYRFKVSTDSSYGEWTDVTSGREQTITDLTPSTAYTFEVRATNTGVGSSPITTTTTPLTPPSAVQNFYAFPDDRAIFLAWDTTHTSFEYRYKTSGGSYNLWTNTQHSRGNIIASLTNDVAYTIELRGKYPLGPGATATATATPNPVNLTATPSNFVATSSDGAVTLTWDAPTGGFPDYQIRYKSGGAYNSWAERGATHDWNGTSFSRTISSLTGSTAYTFEIRGKSGIKYTPTSTATATTPASTAPSAPQNLTATPASNQVTLAWTAPASGTPTGYQYRQKTSSDSYLDNWADTSGRTSTLNQTITSLTNNTTYNFQVRAKSDSGPSTEATVNSTPNDPPTFSSLTTASVNEGTTAVTTLTATDTDTDDNTFTYSIIGGADSDQFSLSAAALTFKTAPDFENPTDATTNNEYIVTLSTTSGSGDREISTSQTLTITVADTDEAPEAPAVPTLDSRTPTTLTLNWIAPTNAGPPITDYDYRYRAGNAGAWNIIANDINDALTFTFTTLTASTSYQVGIRATNAEGTGDWSTSTAFTTLAAPPSAPQSLTAQAGNNQVTLAWTAPASGTPTGYEYRYKSSGAYGNWTTATSPKIIASLTNDTPHTFEVRAKSDSGPGETLTISATPLAPPSAPQNLTATPASNQVTLAWTAPASGTPTGYQYRQKTSSDSYLDNWADTSGRTSTLNQTITSLTNNTTYNFQVRAKSDSGPSTEATVNSTPNSPPTFSSSATASVNEGTISVATLTATDTDTDDNTFTYSIIGGADSDQFSLSAAALSFKTAPDFENPTDLASTSPSNSAKNNEYIITLSTTSGSGDREISTSQTLTITVADTDEAPEAPAVPTLDSRTPTTLTLNWIAPTNAGPPITDYDYRYRAGNAGAWNIIANDINDALTFTFTTLTASTSYQVGIRATNAEGTGDWSTSTSFTTLADTPSAPQNLTAQAGNNQVTLAWTAPASGTPTGYEYRYKSSGAYGNWTTATSPKIIASLTNDTPHTFEVRAKSDSGPGETLTISATPLAPPSAPQNLTATPASNQVTLAWTAPASGTPTGYQYRQKTSSDSYLDNWADTSGRTSTLNQTITSLTNNTTYNFQVRAKSDSGPSTEATVNSTPNSPPTFSSSATASVNEGTISVATLTATDTDTDDNTFTYSIIGGADSDQFSLSAAALSFKTAPDFENPTDLASTSPSNSATNNEYIVTLSTTSGSGDREISTSQTLTITVADTDEAPEAPAVPTLDSRTPTTLTLNWIAPTNAGPPITDYDYRYRAGNAGAWNIIANDINDALTFTFTTLTASTSYQVGIRATNAEGTGDWSTSTSFTTLAAPPSAPQNLTATPASNQVTLAWTAPASGTPTGYQYRQKTSSDSYLDNWADTSGRTSTLNQTITSLTNNTTYNFQVRAKSDSGPSTEATVNSTPNDPPTFSSLTTASVNEGTTAVTTLTATDTDTDDNTFTYSIIGGADSDQFSLSAAALTFKTAPDFENPTDATTNNEYIVTLSTTSGSGDREISTSQTLTITVADTDEAPEAPAVPTLDSRTPTTLTLNWIAPTNAGPPITDYDYRYRAGNAGAWNIIANDINDALTFTFTTLTASTSYQVGIRATNAEGTGDWSTSTAFTTLAAPPSAPQSLTAQAGNNQVTLAWTAPASGTPTGYEYRYKSSGAYGNWTPATSPKIIASLTNDTAYTFEVRAKSDSGPGTEATVSATPLAPPSAPQSLMAQVGNTQITLAWTAPATGATPTGYQYRHKSSGGYNSWTDTTSLSQIIASLTNDTAYTFGVRAKSNSGPGTEATVSATPIASAAANAAPTFTSLATASVNEGTTAVTTLIATDTDVADNTFTYSIIAGADSAKFSINSSSGALTFKTAPDFETPTDATNNTPPNSANNNEYIVIVRVTSGSNARAMTTDQTLTVTVADTDEAPAAPDAPTLDSRTPTTLTLDWIAPTNAGPPITDYDYRYSTDGNSWTTIANTPIDAISTPIVGLSASTLYYVAVRATNAEGNSDWSTSTTFTTPAASVSTVPSAPQSLMAQVGNQQITLAWTAPATGVTPTGYEYRYKSSGDYNSWTDTTSPKIIASLTNNTTYNFQVRAKSDSGPSTEATVNSTPNSPPTFSSSATASVNEGTISVATLTATDTDTDDNTFTYSIIGGADSDQFSLSAAALSFKTAPDFENPTDTTANNEYIITLRVTSGSGDREISTSQTLTVTVADTDEAPEAPAVPTLDSRTPTTLTLNWIAPTNAGPPITDYDYRYRAGNAGAWNIIANDINDALTFTFTTLTASTSYQVGIRATNAEGTGDWSTSTSFTTLADTPSAPQNLTAQAGNNQVTLAWTAPASGTPTGYEYRYKSSGAYGNWTTATSPKIIASLTNDTPHTFEVRAKSDSGPGETLTISATPILPNSPPTFTSLTTATVNEGTTAVTTLTANDTDSEDTTFTYSIVVGADSAQFSINSSSGALTFNTAPDHETPTDLDSNNEYIVTLSVTSGSNPREITTEQTLTITVTDTNEVPTFTSPNTFDIVENQNTITTLIATDPDGDDNTFTYSILGGADNAKFSLSGATLSFKTAPNFEATQSSANTNTYTLIVTATSGSGNRAITTEQTLTINVTDDTTSNDPIDQKAIGQPIITGSPQIGQRLTTSTTTIDDPIDGLTQPQYTYQWIRIEENGNEVVIQSANSYAYTPTQGDLGRTLKVRVEFIDDSGHSEILTSNATAAVTETTSTKELSAWLTRFGRATADQILNTVEERLRAYRSTGITLHFAGQHLPTHLTEDPQHPTENGVYSDSLLSWLTYGTKDQIQSQNMTEQELLMNSSFDLSAGNQENGFASLWGRMSQSTFQGYQNSLQLDGDITTGLLGADYTRGPWTAGLILSRSKGKGNYQGDTTGKAKASLNSLTPWAAYTGADQLSIWAATGYGKGDISLIPQEGSPQKTDIKLLLAALGTRGTLLDPSTGPRIELFSDARWVQTTSKSTTELKATQTHTARLRLGLEGSWYTTLSTGSVLIPRLTLGLRKDSGDAETGFGTDIGTHITLAMPQGLTLSLEARGLLSHQAKGFQDQGWSGTLQWDSKPDSEQGFTLSLSQSKGAASSGGTHALFAHETLEQLTLTNTDTKLIQANIAYGLPPFGNQLTARSELTLGLSDTTRQYSLAWHVSSSYLSAQSFDLSLQGTRHESIDGALAPRHSLGIQLGRQW